MDPKIDMLVSVLKAAQRELSNAPLDVADTGALVKAARGAVDTALKVAQKLTRASATLARLNAAVKLAAETRPHLARARFIERVVLPRSADGIDYSAERFLLVERMEPNGHRTRLYWVKAGKYYADRMSGYQPCGGSLKLDDRSGNRGHHYFPLSVELASGGRLTVETVKRHADAIDKVFGEGVAALVDIKRTLLL